MNLHVEVAGKGEPLVMLHGWGMHGGLWNETAAQLAQQYEVHCVDLPGHGASAPVVKFALDSVVEQLSAQFDQPIIVCGWSLGGLIALHWAKSEPEMLKRLILVASTPCFAERNDWPFGMTNQTLQQFADDLEKNYTTTLKRFLVLQVRGSENERELLADLHERLYSRGEPDIDALRGGLAILRDADLRSILPTIMQPALVVGGGQDKLCPPEALKLMTKLLPNAREVEIRGAAHLPFLSHREEFVEHVLRFLCEIPA